jgi:chorismate mutase
MTIHSPEDSGVAAPDKLDEIRREIDALDLTLIDLIARRTALTLAVAREKQQRGLSTMQPGRHGEVVANYMNGAAGTDLTPQDAVQLAETVMGISRGAQDRYRQAEEARQGEAATATANLAAEAAAVTAQYPVR